MAATPCDSPPLKQPSFSSSQDLPLSSANMPSRLHSHELLLPSADNKVFEASKYARVRSRLPQHLHAYCWPAIRISNIKVRKTAAAECQAKSGRLSTDNRRHSLA